MSYKIYFCNDGVLRLKFENLTMLPMTFIQKKENLNEFKFWIKWWNKDVVFEKGLTVGNFFSCIEPWESFFEYLTDISIRDYILEVKSTIGNVDEPVDWISLGYKTILEPNLDFLEKNLEDLSILEIIEKPKKMQLNGDWFIHHGYELSGFKKNENKVWNVTNLPMSKLKNIELVLDNKQYIKISEHYIKEFNKKSNFVEDRICVGFDKLNNNYYFVGEKYHSFKEILEGFFENFFKSPQVREIVLNTINQDIEEKIKDLFPVKERILKIVGENDEVLKNNKFVEIVKKIKMEKKLSKEQIDWLELVKEAKTDSNVVFKIGKIESGCKLENREDGLINSTDYVDPPKSSKEKYI